MATRTTRTTQTSRATGATGTARRAWVLNLDADLELGAPPGYTPTARVRAQVAAYTGRLAEALLAPGDVRIDESSPPLSARGLPGCAFCPTPRALSLLRRAGAVPEPHPPPLVLRGVNSRAFAAALGPTLPGGAFVTDAGAALAIVCGEPEVGSGWRIKWAFGMTGRNQRVVPPGPPASRDAAFVAAGIARGGVQIEPNVAIEDEFAIHGVVSPAGELRLGVLVRQRCDARGAWVATERIAAPDERSLGDLPARMAEEARLVGGALREAGYFGPFGVDAYRYRDRAGALRLQPRSEVNARYSMGFPVGYGVRS